jgi:tetratricopeptide (TPR) repeat protein
MKSTHIRTFISGVILLLASILFISCATCELTFEEDMTPARYFQKAQLAAKNYCYDVAIGYYEKFREIYPNNIEKGVWAEYEIAVLYHKKGDDTKALELLNALLDRYQADTSRTLPDAPKTLALRVKANIEKSMQK